MKAAHTIFRLSRGRTAIIAGVLAAVLGQGPILQDAGAVGLEITPRPWFRHYDRYNYGTPRRFGTASDYDAYYNFKFGGFTLALTARMAAVWSDNNNRAESSAAEEGWSFRPELTMAMQYNPGSPYYSVDLSLSVGYRWYPDDEVGESDFFLSSDGGVAAVSLGSTVILGEDHYIRLHDRLAYESDTLSAETYYNDDDNTLDYDTWRNTLDATYGRQLHPDWRTELSYAYELRWADADEYDYLDFGSHSLDWTLYWRVMRNIEIGPYMNYRYYDFDTNERNDRDILEGGITANIDDGFGIEGLSMTMNGGYEIVNMRDDKPGVDDEDDGFTASFTTQYQPEGVLPGHRVRSSYRRNHEDPDPTVNYADELLLGYGIDIPVNDKLIFTADVDWMDISESDMGENFNMWRFWVSTNYWLTPKTSCDLTYSFTAKEGTEREDYEQNEVEIGVTHRF